MTLLCVISEGISQNGLDFSSSLEGGQQLLHTMITIYKEAFIVEYYRKKS